MDSEKDFPQKPEDKTDNSPLADDVSPAEDKSTEYKEDTSSQPSEPILPAGDDPAMPDNSNEQSPESDLPGAASVIGQSAPSVASPKQKKTKMMMLIIGLVVLVLGGGSAAAYFGYYVPNKPDNILSTALSNFYSSDKAKSVYFDGELSVKAKSDDQTVKGTFKGASSVEGQFDLSMALDIMVSKLTFDARSTDGKSVFLRVGGLAGLTDLLAASGEKAVTEAYGPIIESVNDQWLEINESLLKQWAGTDQLRLSQEDMDKLAKAYEDNTFLKIKDTLPGENVNGADSYHYKVVIDKAKLKGFLAAVKAADVKSFNMTGEQSTMLNDLLDKANFDGYPVEVWITKNTKMFTKFAFQYSDNEGVLNVFVNLTDYNKPVKVEKPEGAKSIMEVLGKLLTNPFFQQTIEREISADNSGVSL